MKLFTPFLFVGNNEYENIATSEVNRPSLDKGKLWLCMSKSSRFWSLFKMAWQHDITLFDILQRFLSPLGRYKNYISDELLPRYANDDLTVLGINTARSLTWKSGRISDDQIVEMERILYRN